MKQLSWILLLVLLVLLGGSQGKGDKSSGIGNKPGTGNGNLVNIDPLNNGLYQLWVFGDTTYVFCTMDQSLVDEAYRIIAKHDTTMLYTYRDWKVGDQEFDTIDGSLGRVSDSCGQKYKDTHGSKLLTIKSLSNED